MILLIFNSRFIFLVEIKFEVYSNDTVLFGTPLFSFLLYFPLTSLQFWLHLWFVFDVYIMSYLGVLLKGLKTLHDNSNKSIFKRILNVTISYVMFFFSLWICITLSQRWITPTFGNITSHSCVEFLLYYDYIAIWCY